MGIGVIGSLSNTAEVLPPGAIEKIATVKCEGRASLPTLTAGNYIIESTAPLAVYGAAFQHERLLVDNGEGFGRGTAFSLSSTRSDLVAELAKPNFEQKALPTGMSTGRNKYHAHSAPGNPNKIILSHFSNTSSTILQITENGGSTWTSASSPNSNYGWGFVDNSGAIYLDTSVTDNTVYPQKSTTNGVSWSNFVTDQPSGADRRIGFAVSGDRWVAAWVQGTAAVTTITLNYGNTSSPTALGQWTATSLASIAYNTKQNSVLRPIPNSTWVALFTYSNTSWNYNVSLFDLASPPVGGSVGVTSSFQFNRSSNSCYSFPIVPSYLPLYRLMGTSGPQMYPSYIGVGIGSNDTSITFSGSDTNYRYWDKSSGYGSNISDNFSEIQNFRTSSFAGMQRDTATDVNGYMTRYWGWSAPGKLSITSNLLDMTGQDQNIGQKEFTLLRRFTENNTDVNSLSLPNGKLLLFASSNLYAEAQPEYINIYRAG